MTRFWSAAGRFGSIIPRWTCGSGGWRIARPRRILLSRHAAPDGWERISAPQDIATLDRVDHLLVEGGAETAAAFLRAGLVDRLLLYRAPIIIGAGMASIGDIGLTDLADAHGRWRLTDELRLGVDGLEVYEATSSV